MCYIYPYKFRVDVFLTYNYIYQNSDTKIWCSIVPEWRRIGSKINLLWYYCDNLPDVISYLYKTAGACHCAKEWKSSRATKLSLTLKRDHVIRGSPSVGHHSWPLRVSQEMTGDCHVLLLANLGDKRTFIDIENLSCWPPHELPSLLLRLLRARPSDPLQFRLKNWLLTLQPEDMKWMYSR
jgi:hypothetical protein